MSNPTSNYGWQMPTATDLVTDLPADFEVFGQAVDTALMDLKGGTTGQVLKKNTNADMDFVWGADAAGMTNPMTTTGDIIYSSSGSTPARLGIGSSGQVLNVAAGIPAWTTVSSGSMTLLSTTTLSGASTTISSIPTTYKDLKLVCNSWGPSTNAKELKMRFNGDTASNYVVAYVFEEFGVGATPASSESQTYLGFAYATRASNTVTNNNFVIDLFDYASTTTAYRLGSYVSNYLRSSNGAQTMTFGQTMYKNTGTAITSIELFPETTSNQTGTVLLYGVN